MFKALSVFGTLLLSSLLFLFWGSPSKEVLLLIRLPELIASVSFGALLSLSGAVFQNALRNPLAEPYTLGIASSSALGATVSVWLGFKPEVGAFLFSLFSVLLLLLAFKLFRTPLSLLLFGVGLSSLFSSLTLFIYSLLPSSTLQDALYFTLGFITPVSLKLSLFLLLLSLLALALCLKFFREVELLPLGSEIAYFSGVETERITTLLLISLSLLLSPFISNFGVVGFVGIASPHAVRLLGFRVGYSFIFLSFLAGALFTLFSQFLAKNLFYPNLFPVGAVSALFGAPFFLYLLWRYSSVRS